MNWRYKIELNQVLRQVGEQYDLSYVEEDCPQPVKEALAAELRKAYPLTRFAKQILDAKAIAAVNRILQQVYDEADRCAVWCGL